MADALKKQIISVIITVLVVCAVWGTYMWFFATKYNDYIVYYADVKGLQASSPVLLHGARVGKIKDVTFENPRLVKIVIQVKQDIVIHAGAIALLKSTGLVSDKSVSIIDGNGIQTLKNGDVIASDTVIATNENTINAETIKNKLSSANNALQYLRDSVQMLSNLESGVATLDKNMGAYANSSKNLVNMANSFTTTIEHLSTSAKKISSTSKNLLSTTKTLAEKTDKIHQSGIQNNVDTLRRTINALSKAIQNAKQVTTDSKTYIQTSKGIETLNNQTKDYSNHPKGFSILGKSKKKK